jgi:NAD+ kinase
MISRGTMRVAIIGTAYNPSVKEHLQALCDSLHEAGDEVYLYSQFYDQMKDEIITCKECTFFSDHSHLVNVDCFISIGGDGTLLHSVEFVRDSGVPVIGVNTGRLGYLTASSILDAPESIARIRRGDYVIDKRSLLHVDTKGDLFGKQNYALNDFTIYKKDTASMMTIHAHVNGVFLNSYWGDGLIIATPTGSTAYSLSCGGPIVSGECGVFVVTPIAPHNLNVRPLLISDDSIITLTAETRHQNYLATLDSRSESVYQPVEFTIRKEMFCINLVRFANQDFPSTIRGKLLWGIDKRN